ncbi:S8 family peptidase [Saccharothrix syringae]|uniref:S8 family peptidase n=1 Tax=Saccharothrix syringae TaxID=103733 RepID=A0A5Q0GWT5_SACSY|nr:S8 family peptidase [Saccharothrix syringae]QFZ17984.1 S8 family peptidase [Saccharothrix syringae]
MRKLLPGLAAIALAAAGAPHASAEAAVLHAGSPTAVPGSYIVKLADGVAAAAVAGRFADRTTRTFPGSFRGFTARLTPRQARLLAADPAVEYVEQDQYVHANATQPNAPWGLDRIDQRNLPLDTTYGYTTAGRGVTAYVVDTGVRTTHVQFGGRAVHGYDAVDNDFTAQDDNGHGTHVAGAIAGSTYGVAKGVRICAVRVLNGTGSGTISGVVAGVTWVTDNAVKPAVANFSLGGSASVALDDAVRRLIASGVTASVTAGGSNTGVANTSPARVVEAVTSGATNQADARAPFSNYGTGVDLFAPGVGITSAWHTSDTATNTLSGTSVATGFVSGVVARYLETAPAATPAQAHAAVVAQATPLPWGGRLLHWPPTG